MKRVLFSEQWGEIVEYTQFRGKRGQFISDKWGRTLERRQSPYVKRQVEEWLYRDGKRVERVTHQSPDRVLKTTAPFAVSDAEDFIYDALKRTNIMTQVGKADRALINIRGVTRRGEEVRIQDEIKLGKNNADQQLAMAAEKLLEREGFGDPDFYVKRYEQFKRRMRGYRTRKPRIGLRDVQIAVTLFR